MNIAFASDLHLFSRRSQADRYEAQLRQAAARSRVFVFGGDIFDFRWSTRGSAEATGAAAIEWLERFMEPHSHCEFHYVLGNHDSAPQWVARLDELAGHRQRFAWHPYFLRVHDAIFLHGDVIEGATTHAELDVARARYEHDKPRGPWSNLLYDLAVGVRLHRLAALSRSRRRVVRRLRAYLTEIGHGPENGLAHVFFGHTHVPVINHAQGGLRFHNGGAPVRGLAFRVVEHDAAGGSATTGERSDTVSGATHHPKTDCIDKL